MTFIYHSGPPTAARYRAKEDSLCSHRLFSLHGNYVSGALSWLADTRNHDTRPRCVLLDSGAFTAWNHGDEVHLEDVIRNYATFNERAEGLFDEVWMINLDKIPGRAGRDPTPNEIREAMAVSDQNFDVLNNLFPGRVLPVFHQGEPLHRLETVREQSGYVCLSPRNDVGETHRIEWSRKLHAKYPSIVSHGLAATGIHMLRSVPWYSVDSAVWRLYATYGSIAFSTEKGFKAVFVSTEGGKQKDWDTHIDTLPAIMREYLVSRIEAYGFTLEEAREDMNVRALITMGELSRVVDRGFSRTVILQEGLFDA